MAGLSDTSRMKSRLFLILVLLAALVHAQDESAPTKKTWEEEIAKGFLPYHQLTVDDFRVDDSKSDKEDFSFQSFIHPRYNVRSVPAGNATDAIVEDWKIFAGLDRNGSYRRSKYKEMQSMLPYVQAFLDLTEIHARELAALKPDALPHTRATSFFDAKTELDAAVSKLVGERFSKINEEAEAFTRATKKGKDTKKVAALAGEIRKRLEATPKATVPHTP